MNNSIKYRYAYLENESIIDIANVKKKNTFKCISCGNELIAKRGDKMTHHFAHKNITPSCSFETYLHQLAKTTFFNEYQKCLKENKPFFIEYPTERDCINVINEINNNKITEALKANKRYLKSLKNHDSYTRQKKKIVSNAEFYCERVLKYKRVDLTKHYTKVYLEKPDKDFIIDVLLETENGEKLYVEIFVTHSSSVKKIASKTKILELNINNENDIQTIRKHNLPSKYNLLTYYNINPPKEDVCEKCLELGGSFIVLKNKTISYKDCNIAEHTKFIKNNNINYSEFLLLDFLKLLMSETVKLDNPIKRALKEGVEIIDCFLCNHYSKKKSNFQTIYCEKLNNFTQSNHAISCEHYILKKKKKKHKILKEKLKNTNNDKSKKYRCKYLMSSFPDLGKHYSSNQYKHEQITTLNFESIVCKEITFLDNNLYSFISDYIVNGTIYGVIFCFSSDKLEKLLAYITDVQLLKDFKSDRFQIFKNPEPMVLEDLRFIIDIKAKLGDKIKCENQTIVPFVVEEFKNFR